MRFKKYQFVTKYAIIFFLRKNERIYEKFVSFMGNVLIYLYCFKNNFSIQINFFVENYFYT